MSQKQLEDLDEFGIKFMSVLDLVHDAFCSTVLLSGDDRYGYIVWSICSLEYLCKIVVLEKYQLVAVN